MAKNVTDFSKRTIKSVTKRKKIILKVFGVIVIAGVFLSAGYYIGNGSIQFGNGHFISINTSNAQGLPASLNYAAVQQEYNILKLNFDGKLSGQQLQDGVQTGLTTATGDPFTEYFNPTAAKTFNDELNNTFSGIGAELSVNSKGQIVVMSPLVGYPAAKAGLQAQDIILSINGKTTAGMTSTDAVNAIRGPNGSTVTLVVERNGQQLTFKIVREQIIAPSVQWSVINGNVGYMQITSFASDTPNLAQEAANDFKSKGVKYVILDLRDNPGGLVTSAVAVSSLWLPTGQTILLEKHDNQVIQTYQSTGNNILQGIPTVVLINGGSASASEITAGALHDNKAAIVMGQQSYGKGSVQQIFNLAGGAEMKVTIAHWFTPDDKSINKVGIKPDVIVTEDKTDQSNNVDTVKNAAIKYLQTH